MIVMMKEERDELKIMITDLLSAHSQITQGKFDIINLKLDQLNQQVMNNNTKTNKLENDIIKLQFSEQTHQINCPHNKKIEKLESESVSGSAIRKFLIAALGIVVSLSALFAFVYETFIK